MKNSSMFCVKSSARGKQWSTLGAITAYMWIVIIKIEKPFHDYPDRDPKNHN